MFSPRASIISVVCLMALMVFSVDGVCKNCLEGCSTGDCHGNDISQQNLCVEVTAEQPRGECEWYSYGLARHTDQKLRNGTIVAFKVQWFSGSWSGWFIPGYNDMDCKYNAAGTCNGVQVCGKGLRRWWSYFADHVHTYIICRNQW